MKTKKLTFCVSGKLWNRSLVMLDLETETLWSHILGEAMQGELKGTQLEIIPAEMLTWAAWKKQHPDTTVLDMAPTRFRDFRKSFYDRSPKAFVFGAVVDYSPVHFTWPSLQKDPVQSAKAGDIPVLVVANKESTVVRLFDRRLDGKTLQFARKDGGFTDSATGTIWSEQGEAIQGKFAGKKLTPLAGLMSFAKAWKRFHPNSRKLDE